MATTCWLAGGGSSLRPTAPSYRTKSARGWGSAVRAVTPLLFRGDFGSPTLGPFPRTNPGALFVICWVPREVIPIQQTEFVEPDRDAFNFLRAAHLGPADPAEILVAEGDDLLEPARAGTVPRPQFARCGVGGVESRHHVGERELFVLGSDRVVEVGDDCVGASTSDRREAFVAVAGAQR